MVSQYTWDKNTLNQKHPRRGLLFRLLRKLTRLRLLSFPFFKFAHRDELALLLFGADRLLVRGLQRLKVRLERADVAAEGTDALVDLLALIAAECRSKLLC